MSHHNKKNQPYHNNSNQNNHNRSNYNPNNSYHRQRSRDYYYQGNNNQLPSNFNGNHSFFDHQGQRSNPEYRDSPKIIRQVFPVDIGNAKVYLVWKYDKSLLNSSVKERLIDFSPKIIKDSKPPVKIQPESSRLSELKNAITPVEQIWGQLIKQYLNDSQFVQIYRKKNSLSYQSIEYGKSIINYDGMHLNEKKFYNNQETQYNIFSRAYFKLWEILSLGILQSKRQEDITIANLAQGPGGFIHSLIDFRLKQNKTLQDRYYAITLKIEQGKTRMAKDWSDYRSNAFFQKITKEGYKVKLSYGQSGDGNLYNIQNIESFKNHVMEGRQAFLVTGDGGIECIGDDEYNYQEIFNGKLFFSEILTALRIQQIGGTFVLKIYDNHFEITNQLIMLLCVFYRKVGLIKPLTSRPGNSQKYLLCEGFFGISQEELSKLTGLLKEWHSTQNKLSYFQNSQYLQTILSFTPRHPELSIFQQTIRQRINLINSHLSKDQETKIEEGLELIKRHEGNKHSIKQEIQEKRLDYQVSYAYEWCRKYGIRHIEVKVVQKK